MDFLEQKTSYILQLHDIIDEANKHYIYATERRWITELVPL